MMLYIEFLDQENLESKAMFSQLWVLRWLRSVVSLTDAQIMSAKLNISMVILEIAVSNCLPRLAWNLHPPYFNLPNS
jgi:hypothetical protein